jgi:hypothetical protein
MLLKVKIKDDEQDFDYIDMRDNENPLRKKPLKIESDQLEEITE